MRIVGTPGAEVRVDDHAFGHTPLALSLPRSHEARLITVRRPGFVPQVRRVAGNADVTVRAVLVVARRKTAPGTTTAAAGRSFNPDVISDPFAR